MNLSRFASPKYRRAAKGVAAGVVGMAIPLDKIVLAVMLGVQLRNIWLMEMQNGEEAGARSGGDSGGGSDSGGGLHPQTPLGKFIDGLPEEYYEPPVAPTT